MREIRGICSRYVRASAATRRMLRVVYRRCDPTAVYRQWHAFVGLETERSIFVFPKRVYEFNSHRRARYSGGQRTALEPSRVFFVHPNELDQVFDTEIGERLDAIFSEDGAAMRARISVSHACGSTPYILAVMIRLYMAAARRPPRSNPQNSQDFRPRTMPLSPRSAALF